jgi:hypothetical protein
MTARRRLTIAPVLPYLDAVAFDRHHHAGRPAALAELLGVSLRTAHRVLTDDDGIPEHHADTLAARLGCHPLNLWPEWVEADHEGETAPCSA